MIRSAPLRPELEVLAPAAVERLHAATLRLLEEVGIGMATGEVPESLQPLADHGARLQRDRIFFPPELVESAVERCPGELLLAGRAPDLDLRVDGSRAFLSTDGCAAEILDPGADEARPSTVADVREISRLADAVDEISFLWQPVAARDVPKAVASLYELRAQLQATTKHLQMMTAATPHAAAGVVAMARAAAGGADELRDRPLLSAFQCSVSPLAYEPDALEAALEYGRVGIPCGFVVMPIAGASAPITPWGAVLQANVEVLAGITVLETLFPGTPTFYGVCTTVMDLRSGAAACGGPEDLLFQLAGAQLARHYGLPASIGTFATGSPRSDWQAGLENGVSGLASLLGGASLLNGAGLLEAARVFSPEQMLLDAESFRFLTGFVERTHQGHEESTAASFEGLGELLEAVGPAGHFLDQDHTLEHMGELWQPRMFTRQSRDEWRQLGRPGPRERARQRLRDLLEDRDDPEVPDDLTAELDEIVEEFEAKAPAA